MMSPMELLEENQQLTEDLAEAELDFWIQYSELATLKSDHEDLLLEYDPEEIVHEEIMQLVEATVRRFKL
jgi:hypothetical protein